VDFIVVAERKGAQNTGEGFQGRSIKAGAGSFSRTEIKITLPSPFYSAGGLLEGIAEERAKQAYLKLGCQVPQGLSVPGLGRAKKMLQTVENSEFFRAKANTINAVEVAGFNFYTRSFNLEWFHKRDLAKFFSHFPPLGEHRLTVNGRHFCLGMDGEYLVAKRDTRHPLEKGVSVAISLIHLRDMLQTCSIEAALKYANQSVSLCNDGLLKRISSMFDFVASQGENPKMAKLGQLLSERQGKKCAVLCKSPEQLEVLKTKFPGVLITNTPSKEKFSGIQTVIIYNPDKNTVKAAWGSGAGEKIVLVAAKTIDDEGYWQNSLRSDARARSDCGIQTSLQF
jgi:hypothetical protein